MEKIFFDPSKELKNQIDLFRAKSEEKNLKLITNTDENFPASIKTDPLRLKQVIANLMSNAIKFTNKGKSIYVSIEFTSTMLSVSVKDEGIGIPKDKIDKIFDVFNQGGDESTTRRYGGAGGLGLAISKDLIRLLGGELKVESTEGEGSVFFTSPSLWR